MSKTLIIITLSSLLFVSSCTELRYAAASFRSTKKVAPKIKDREIAVIMLSSDGSTIKKINKNEQAKTYLALRNQLSEELKKMINDYKNRDVQPLQIAGDDDQSATYRPSREYIRISKNY